MWMVAAALVINSFYSQIRDLASALGLGKPDEGHLCVLPIAEIRSLLFTFKKSLYRVMGIERAFIYN